MTAAQIVLTFPAQPGFVRLVRLASADVATRAGFDFEEMDDLRIAVSEMCSLAVGGAEGVVTLAFTFDDGMVMVEGAGPAGEADEHGFAARIITAVADEHQIDTDDGKVRFRLVKRHHA
jgi:serine/threonine-protein kinase RsbW